jgi:hypothetical protein
MGWQGYLILGIIIAGTGLFAATRDTWTAMLVSAFVLPLVLVALIQVASRLCWDAPRVPDRRSDPGQSPDILSVIARTNPFMLLLVYALTRRPHDDRFQELFRFGPYGMGTYGYLVALAVVLGPLILSLMAVALTGQLPAHGGSHFP